MDKEEVKSKWKDYLDEYFKDTTECDEKGLGWKVLIIEDDSE